MAIANSLMAARSVHGRGLSMIRYRGTRPTPNAGATKMAIRANSGTAVPERQSQKRRLRSQNLSLSPLSRSQSLKKLRRRPCPHSSRVSSSGVLTVKTSLIRTASLLKTVISAPILGLLVIQTNNDQKWPSADANLLVSQIEQEFCRDWGGNRNTTNKRMN